MPEISVCLFDLRLLFKLFVKENKELNKKIAEFELLTEYEMAHNRAMLFD